MPLLSVQGWEMTVEAGSESEPPGKVLSRRNMAMNSEGWNRERNQAKGVPLGGVNFGKTVGRS